MVLTTLDKSKTSLFNGPLPSLARLSRQQKRTNCINYLPYTAIRSIARFYVQILRILVHNLFLDNVGRHLI